MTKKKSQTTPDPVAEQASPFNAASPDDQPDVITLPDAAQDGQPDGLAAERALIEARIAGIEAEIAALERQKAAATRELDAVILRMQATVIPHENQVAILTAIERSNEQRAARAAEVQALIDRGVPPEALAVSPLSPLDQAIGLKNRSKFAKRPQYKAVA